MARAGTSGTRFVKRGLSLLPFPNQPLRKRSLPRPFRPHNNLGGPVGAHYDLPRMRCFARAVPIHSACALAGDATHPAAAANRRLDGQGPGQSRTLVDGNGRHARPRREPDDLRISQAPSILGHDSKGRGHLHPKWMLFFVARSWPLTIVAYRLGPWKAWAYFRSGITLWCGR